MATIMYACGCSFSYSMFGERELITMSLCSKHLASPEVLDAKVRDVHDIVMEDQTSVEEKGVFDWSITPAR